MKTAEHPRCKDCDKQAYPSRACAFGIALKRSRDAGSLRVYRCPKRNGWHLTSKRGRA